MGREANAGAAKMAVYDLAGPDWDYPERDGPPARSILICTHPRSGSTLLSETMAFAGGMGCPLEYFHRNFISSMAARWRFTDAAGLVAALHRHRTDPGGTFSAKLFWDDLGALVAQADPPLGASLLSGKPLSDAQHRALHAQLVRICPDPQWIWLERSDRLGQAVSHVRASQSGHWRRLTNIESAGEPPPPSYDFGAILEALGYAAAASRGWERFFAANGIQPHRVTYEELAADREAVVRPLFQALGHGDAPVQAVRLVRQADSISQDWARRFAQDIAGAKPGSGQGG